MMNPVCSICGTWLDGANGTPSQHYASQHTVEELAIMLINAQTVLFEGLAETLHQSVLQNPDDPERERKKTLHYVAALHILLGSEFLKSSMNHTDTLLENIAVDLRKQIKSFGQHIQFHDTLIDIVMSLEKLWKQGYSIDESLTGHLSQEEKIIQQENSKPPSKRRQKRKLVEIALDPNEGSVDTKKVKRPIILRSGRIQKSKQHDEDFIYFSDVAASTEKVRVHSKKNAESNSNVYKIQCGKQPTQLDLSETYGELSKPTLLDILGSDFDFSDWPSLGDNDVKIEDIDIMGLDDIMGAIPDNQTLTIENLLEELEGGGSIEISNITKENNFESETIIVDEIQNTCQLGKKTSKNSFQQPTQTTLRKIDNSRTLRRVTRKCPFCSKQFDKTNVFERHVREHDPEYRFSCEYCSKSFQKISRLAIHRALHSSTVYACTHCNKTYTGKRSYNRHMKSHSNPTVFNCDKCEAQFHIKSNLVRHMKGHLKKKCYVLSKNYRCNSCGDVKDQTNFDVHPSDVLVTCNKCMSGVYKKFYLSMDTDNSGKNDTHDQNEPRLQSSRKIPDTKRSRQEEFVRCKTCGESLRKKSLRFHMHRKHNSVKVLCHHCNRYFKNVLTLQEHLRRVKRKTQRPK